MHWYLWYHFELHKNEKSRDMTKPTKWLCAQRRLRSAWASAQSNQSLRRMKKAWVLSYPLSEQQRLWSQTGRMPRLIWVFAGLILNLLVLSCRGSNIASRYVATPFIVNNRSITKWAASRQNQQNGMCAQRRLRSAWADQSLRCPLFLPHFSQLLRNFSCQ